MPEKRPLPLFRVFARGYMHAFGAHLPLEKCKSHAQVAAFCGLMKSWASVSLQSNQF